MANLYTPYIYIYMYRYLVILVQAVLYSYILLVQAVFAGQTAGGYMIYSIHVYIVYIYIYIYIYSYSSTGCII